MIFLDLDGVLANFTDGACKVHGRLGYCVKKWDWYSDWGYSDDDFWRPIEELGEDFYSKWVKPFPWNNDILRLVRSHGEFVIATANPLHPGLASSKTRWINEHIRGPVDVMMGNRKDLFSAPGRILIDDSDDNISRWRESGGDGILFPQPWNENRILVGERVQVVREQLEVLTSNAV